jgi:hypothetical protein
MLLLRQRRWLWLVCGAEGACRGRPSAISARPLGPITCQSATSLHSGTAGAAWWASEWRRADMIVLNFGHHFRNVDGSFNSYYRVVLDAIAAARDVGKPTAQV